MQQLLIIDDQGEAVEDCVSKFKDALLSLDRLQAKSIMEEVLNGSNSLMTVEQLLVPVMEALGRGWEDGSLALTQIYMSGRICEELVDEILQPCGESRSQRPVLALAVFEDYHLLGKRIVNSVLRSGGYKVLDYGPGQGVDELVARVRQDDVDILLISVLMLNSALRIRLLSDRLKSEGLATRFASTPNYGARLERMPWATAPATLCRWSNA